MPICWPPSPTSAFDFLIPPVEMTESKMEELLAVLPPDLQSDPLFTCQNIIYAIQHYFVHYYPSYPVLHISTFSTIDTPPLLLWSIIVLGSFFTTDDDFGRPFYEIMLRLVNTVRLTAFGMDEFHPPASLWVLQTLLFIEVFENHVRAVSVTKGLIYFMVSLQSDCFYRFCLNPYLISIASTITLMRRGSSLMQPAPSSD
jgi:hypothetical protein